MEAVEQRVACQVGLEMHLREIARPQCADHDLKVNEHVS
jgi:hypothetical protein